MSNELPLPPTVESVGVGRRFVEDALAAWGLEDLAFTTALLTSEVLTNSVLHARTPILLTVEREGLDCVTVSVHDGSVYEPRRRRHAQDATTGRGVELLEKLSHSWGVRSDPPGKTLSFTVGGGVDPWEAFTGSDWVEAELS